MASLRGGLEYGPRRAEGLEIAFYKGLLRRRGRRDGEGNSDSDSEVAS